LVNMQDFLYVVNVVFELPLLNRISKSLY